MTCSCHIVGLLSMNYSGIISASLNGGTKVSVASDGTVLLGQTLNTLSISAWAYTPSPTGVSDRFLGASCAASAQATLRWIQKYDCTTDTTYFIPQAGGAVSITNGPINNVTMTCDPNISSKSFSASASSGPTTAYVENVRKDGYNLVYTGTPIAISSGNPSAYNINLGPFSVRAYLQTFSLTVNPPSSATVSYSFVIPGLVS